MGDAKQPGGAAKTAEELQEQVEDLQFQCDMMAVEIHALEGRVRLAPRGGQQWPRLATAGWRVGWLDGASSCWKWRPTTPGPAPWRASRGTARRFCRAPSGAGCVSAGCWRACGPSGETLTVRRNLDGKWREVLHLRAISLFGGFDQPDQSMKTPRKPVGSLVGKTRPRPRTRPANLTKTSREIGN